MPDNWREIVYNVKQIHDDFLRAQTSMSFQNFEKEKDNSFAVKWGSFRSDYSIMKDIPSAEIVIRYDNITEEDDKRLEKLLGKYF